MSTEQHHIRFKDFVSEARRNPDQNPKVSTIEALSKYKDDSSIFISFTANMDNYKSLADRDTRSNKSMGAAKIGINPRSSYNTPLGIYTLPLKKAWDYYNLDGKVSISKAVQLFCSGSPFIWVLRLKDGSGYIRNMQSDYTSVHYDRDYNTLHQIYIDHWEAQIKDQEKKFRRGSTFSTDSDELDSWREVVRDGINQRWRNIEREALETAREKNPIMSFWNLSRLLGVKLANPKISNGASVKWNSLLRQCGYSGFGDLSANGYIHPAEPLQAVFLSMQPLEVVEKIYNKDYINTQPVTFIKLVDLIIDGTVTINQAVQLLNRSITLGDMTFKNQYIFNINSMLVDPDMNDIQWFFDICLSGRWGGDADELVEVWEYILMKSQFKQASMVNKTRLRDMIREIYKVRDGNN